jgi:hypothetical protein
LSIIPNKNAFILFIVQKFIWLTKIRNFLPMDKEKIIIRLSTQIDTLNAHINRLKRSGYNIHSLDIDMLKQKTIEFYEMIFDLEPLVNKNADLKKDNIIIPEPKTNEKLKEEDEVTIEETVEEEIVTPSSEVNETEEVIEESKIAKPVITTQPIAAEPKTKQAPPPIVEEIGTVNKEEDELEEPDVIQNSIQQTAYELFSASTDNPVAEKYQIKDEQSIADKIQKSNISNIREAIGINEKFLFINELFNGDLGRYNKILDDINELPTKKGVDTYLFELKIEFQWTDENEAYIILKEILERKIN